MLSRLHLAHLGYDSMLHWARNKIFWIGMNSEIKEIWRTYEPCDKMRPRNEMQPLQQHGDRKAPWDKTASDIFVIENRYYLLIIIR